jgi:primary-amine oxidase
MALDRLKSVAQHVTGTGPPPHPFDPLSNAEIETAVQIISKEHGKLHFNAVTLREPAKKEMLKWLEDSTNIPRPTRVADVVAIAPGGKVYDGLVDLKAGKIIKWEALEGVQPLVSYFERYKSLILTKDRSQWRISRLLSMLFEKTQRLLNNV